MEKRDIVGVVGSYFRLKEHRQPRQITRKVYYSILPVSSQVPGGGIALITAATAGFYLGDGKSRSLSTVVFSPYVTFEGRIGFALRSAIWLPSSKWEIIGDVRFLYYPEYTWGLGGSPGNQDKISINYKYVRFYQTLLRKVKPYFFAGIGYAADAHYDIKTINDTVSLQKFTGYPYGTAAGQNSVSSGLTLNLLYDPRKNAFNPLPGVYGNVVYRANPRFMGGTNGWQSLYLDLRRYLSFSNTQQNMLAFWSFYWTALQTHAPYLDLPSIGWDPYSQRSGRGIEQSRYMGNRLLYFETEYRRDITADGLFGFVLFSNVSSVSEPLTNQFSYLHLAAGGGLRIKFNKHSGTNISLDYGASRTFSALYLNLGETF